MANIEQLDIIKFGVHKWNRWRDTNPSLNPDLNYSNLSSNTFPEINLKNANLSKADLRQTNLRKADLTKSDLRGADLSEADLSGAILRGANLFDANLEGTILDEVNASGIKIHYNALSYMSDSLKKQFGPSLYII